MGKRKGACRKTKKGSELGWGARNVDSSVSSPPLPSYAQRSNGDATAAEKANPPAAKCHSKNSGLRQIDTLETTQEAGCTRALSRTTTERLHPHAAYRPMFERGYIRCMHGEGTMSKEKCSKEVVQLQICRKRGDAQMPCRLLWEGGRRR